MRALARGAVFVSLCLGATGLSTDLVQVNTHTKGAACPPLSKLAEHGPNVNLAGCLYSTILLSHDGEVMNGHKHRMCVCHEGMKCVGCVDTCTLNGLSLFTPGEGVNCAPVPNPPPHNSGGFWSRTWAHISGDATMDALVAACVAAAVFAGKKVINKLQAHEEKTPTSSPKGKEAVEDGATGPEVNEETALVITK